MRALANPLSLSATTSSGGAIRLMSFYQAVDFSLLVRYQPSTLLRLGH